MGSRITLPIVSSITASSRDGSLYGTNLTPSNSGINDFLYFSLYVTESAPNVLPWYPPFIAITPCLPLYLRANFSAASTDSAPLLAKNILFKEGGATDAIFSMNLNRVSLYVDMWAVMSISACLLRAFTTLSLQWPTSATP